MFSKNVPYSLDNVRIIHDIHIHRFYPDIIVKMCGPSGLHSAVRPTILKSRGYFLKFHILTILVNMRWSVRIRIPASLWARWVLLVGLELPHTTTLNQLYKTFFILIFFQDKNVWSAWSSCSRSCDGGITWRHRCSNHSSEGGPCLPQGLRESQHKICNMHSCPEASEVDQDHCVQHNDVQHEVSFGLESV